MTKERMCVDNKLLAKRMQRKVIPMIYRLPSLIRFSGFKRSIPKNKDFNMHLNENTISKNA